MKWVYRVNDAQPLIRYVVEFGLFGCGVGGVGGMSDKWVLDLYAVTAADAIVQASVACKVAHRYYCPNGWEIISVKPAETTNEERSYGHKIR